MNGSNLDAEVAAHDLVISLVPYIHHATVIKSAIKGHTNVVTTSYASPDMRALDNAVKEAGIVVLNEVGVDPGVDHLYAIKTISGVHEKGGKVCISPRYFEHPIMTSNLDPGVSFLLWGLAGSGMC